jgi:DNA repair exonuclease SbcCD ATPase subunit
MSFTVRSPQKCAHQFNYNQESVINKENIKPLSNIDTKSMSEEEISSLARKLLTTENPNFQDIANSTKKAQLRKKIKELKENNPTGFLERNADSSLYTTCLDRPALTSLDSNQTNNPLNQAVFLDKEYYMKNKLTSSIAYNGMNASSEFNPISTIKSDRLQFESNIQLGSGKGEPQAIKEQIAQLSSDKGELQSIKEQIAQLSSDKGELQSIKEQIAQLSSDKGELQSIKEQIAQLQKKQNDLLNCLKEISKIILIISIVVIFNNFVLKNKQTKKG